MEDAGSLLDDHDCEAAPPGPSGEAPSASPVALQILAELPFLRRTVRRWHQSGADSEDLVQDTLIRALASSHSWQSGSNLRAWLFTIMRNVFLASREREKRAGMAAQAYTEVNSASELQDSEARLVLRDVGRVLDRMPEAQSVALMLVGVEGKSYEEVAQAMDLSIASVRCHLSRARTYLRDAVLTRDYSSPVATSRGTGPGHGPRRGPIKQARLR